jgi:hypothetical protein
MSKPVGFSRVTFLWRLGAIAFAGATIWLWTRLPTQGADTTIDDGQPLRLPEVGASGARLLAPTLLELTFVTTKAPDPARPDRMDFVDPAGRSRLPKASDFAVSCDGKPVGVKAVGFKRRVLYAPIKQRDLRIANYLYLQLVTEVKEGQVVEIVPAKTVWPGNAKLTVAADPFRWNPFIHVNQTGYLPSYAKKAMIGYYAGTFGELEPRKLLTVTNGAGDLPPFKLVEEPARREVFQGKLTARPDRGFPDGSYQRVLEADFTEFNTPGQYRLFVPGLGVSTSFNIEGGVAGAFARSYALGIYHQRCGTANQLPFTRFVHNDCHTAPAEVPQSSKKFESVEESLKKETENYKDNPRHTAPQMKNLKAALYPYVNRGPVDVHGGHHDAGDYSKYTANSASFIHFLVFAADVFPGVADLDNLGLPESGDGKSDILQEAKWEADFLARMQDADGGFYFLVYPRDREYETDVLPDHGDPQVVFPKTTSVTAAATAALAQCASSPRFKKEFGAAASQYLEQAKKGWQFLEKAIAKYGKDGAYQKITHYGDTFQHDDELAWAACELFLATGDDRYQKQLIEWFDPSDANTRLWGWLRLFDAYGATIRSYAFAEKAGKVRKDQLRPLLLEQCEAEIAASGEDQLRRAQESAYGTSFPEETKRIRTAGWYFSSDQAFDLATAYQLSYPAKNDPRPKILEALISNLNYEQGCNPVNVTYLTGLGWHRQREIVHQYAMNDRRVLPPTGIPLGNLQAGFGWLEFYKAELGSLSFPLDSAQVDAYPIYDRWGDSFNLTQEFVILNQARALGYLAWLMARSPLAKQQWRAAGGQLTGLPNSVRVGTKLTIGLAAPGIELQSARIVWEVSGEEPQFGNTLTFQATRSGAQWLEAEAQLVDGRRIYAVTNFGVTR